MAKKGGSLMRYKSQSKHLKLLRHKSGIWLWDLPFSYFWYETGFLKVSDMGLGLAALLSQKFGISLQQLLDIQDKKISGTD